MELAQRQVAEQRVGRVAGKDRSGKHKEELGLKRFASLDVASVFRLAIDCRSHDGVGNVVGHLRTPMRPNA